MAIFDDLEAEQDRLEEILTGLDGAQWAAPSAAAGWNITDVVLHLAQTEEAVVASVGGAALRPARESGTTVDQLADDMVRAQPARRFLPGGRPAAGPGAVRAEGQRPARRDRVAAAAHLRGLKPRSGDCLPDQRGPRPPRRSRGASGHRGVPGPWGPGACPRGG